MTRRYPPLTKDAAPVKRKQRREGDSPKHRAWIRQAQCLALHYSVGPHCRGRVQAAHIRTGTDGGMGKKPHDKWCVPLCALHHGEQHQVGETRFWKKYDLGIESARATALAFAKWSPDPAIRGAAE